MTKVVFARPPQAVCCANANSCVIWNECVSPGSSVYDVDGDEDTDYCVNNGGNGEWADCGSDSNCAANEWCNTGTKDCVNDLGLCSATACNRDAQCLGSLKCINNKCRVAETEAGLCSNGIDDDCDGKTDGQGNGDPDCNCCGTLGNPCCTVGTACTEGYCADGGSDADHCCIPGEKWDEVNNECVGTTQCNPTYCPYEPFQSDASGSWWTTNGCFLESSSLACCDVGLKYGVSNYYDYEDADGNLNIKTY